jgi:hypothetical protein
MLENLLYVLVGGLIGYWLGHSGDAAAKRKRFRSYIKLLRREIEAKRPDEFVFDFHKVVRGVPKFEIETLEVSPHIRERNVARFDAACAEYKTLPFGEVGTPETNANAQKAKAKLISLLDEISGYSK